MSMKLSLAVITVIWVGYVVYAGTFYAATWSMFN